MTSLIFDAGLAASGISNYRTVYHPERISVVDDPELGAARKVMRMQVFDTDTGPTSNPRAQVQTPSVLRSGDDLWVGFGLYLPATWPVFPANGWSTFHEIFGPPYGGHSPLIIGCWQDGDELVVHRNEANGYDYPARIPVQRETWLDFAVHAHLSTDPAVGFYEIELNTGSGWAQVPLHGQTRLYMATLDATNSGGPNHSGLKLYRRAGMFSELTCYFAAHKIGFSRAAVDPGSYT